MSSTSVDLGAGTVLIARALGPYNIKPDEIAIAALIDDLLRHGTTLVAEVSQYEAAAAVLDDWHRQTIEGPTDSPLANWNHARALARCVRTMHRILTGQPR